MKPSSFRCKHSCNEQNQLSQNNQKFWWRGNVSINFSTQNAPVHFWPFSNDPEYEKKSYIIPEDPDVTKFLKPHFTGFFGLHYLIPPLCDVFVGIICLSIHWFCSSSIVKQLPPTWFDTGSILYNLFLFSSSICFKLSLQCKYWRSFL